MKQIPEENFSLLSLCPDIDFTGLAVGSILQAKSLLPDLFKFALIDKAALGLDNVINDKQAKADFSGYTEKTSPVNADILAINDSEDSYLNKKAQLGNIINAGNYTSIYVDVSSADYLTSYTSPVLILPAPGINKYYDIITMEFSMVYNSIPYNGNGVLTKFYLHDLPIDESLVSSDYYFYVYHNITTDKIATGSRAVSTSNLLNAPLYLRNSFTVTNGNSPLKVFIRYRILSI